MGAVDSRMSSSAFPSANANPPLPAVSTSVNPDIDSPPQDANARFQWLRAKALEQARSQFKPLPVIPVSFLRPH
jgi:hypothetical protein